MYNVIKTFICRSCMVAVTGTGCTSVDIGVNASLQLVDKFCYLGNMLNFDGDADAAVETKFELDETRISLIEGDCAALSCAK